MSGVKKAAKKVAAELAAREAEAAAKLAAEKKALRSARARVAGYKAAASMTPEQRVARARKAGLASAERRARDRAALGLPEPVKRGDRAPRVSANELSDFLEQFDREHPGQEFTYEERRSGAILLFKRWIAEQTVRRLAGGNS